MSNIINTLARSHPPSLAQSITAQEYPGKYAYAGEGGSIAVIDTTLSSTFEATRGVKKFPVGDRGVIPRRMLYDPADTGTADPTWRQNLFIAGGLDGLWAISPSVETTGALHITSNRATRLDDRQDYNVDVQDNIRMCNDVKIMTVGTTDYLVALFQAKDDNRLRVYDLDALRDATEDSKIANLETGYEVQAVVEVILGEHPSVIAGAAPNTPATSLWGSIGLGMTVYGPDVYVAMGTNGIVKVSFSSAATPVATTVWGPIFGTGSAYETGLADIPSNASTNWYKNLVFSGHDGATTKEELPIFSDVAVDTAGGYLFAAMETLGWVKFDITGGTWATDMAISHHEGEPRDANEEPLFFRLRYSTVYDSPTHVRTMVVKSSAASGDILAITGNQAHTVFDQFSRLPGITYDPVFDWNHSFANAPAGGENYTALYRINDLSAGKFNNVSLDRVGGGDVFLTKHDTDNIMNVYNFGRDNYSNVAANNSSTSFYSAPMTINHNFYPDNTNLLTYTTDIGSAPGLDMTVEPADVEGTHWTAPAGVVATFSSIDVENPFLGLSSTNFSCHTGPGFIKNEGLVGLGNPTFQSDKHSIFSIYVKNPGGATSATEFKIISQDKTSIIINNEVTFGWDPDNKSKAIIIDEPDDHALSGTKGYVQYAKNGWYRCSISTSGVGKGGPMGSGGTQDGDRILSFFYIMQPATASHLYISSPKLEQRDITSSNRLPGPYQPVPAETASITHVESTSTVQNNANRYVRSIANHVRGNFTFEVDRSILDENALITGGNDGGDNTKNDGFLVRGVVDGKEVIKAWDASALNSDPNVQTKLGIRTTDFAQWKKCGPPGARGQYAAGERFTHTIPPVSYYGYWNFKSINVPQDPYNNEPFTLGDHAIMYPRNSFGVVSERPYYGAISRSSEYDDYLASQGKSPYLFMNATNSPEGLIMASRDSLLEPLGKPYTDNYEHADTFLVSNTNAYTAFITHPEVSGMPRNTEDGSTQAEVDNAKDFWQYKAGNSQPPFFSWMPEVFPIMDSGTEKWIACVPCHNIINYPKLIADVARKAPSPPTATNPLVVLDPSWEAGDVFYTANRDHGMAMFFDITDPTTLAKGNLTPISSPFPKILLPINSLSNAVGSAVWKAKHVVLGGITYIVVIDMMGSVYAYNAADIFTVTGPTLTATGSWDVPPSNFDKQSNNAFALDIDKVNSTDTSAYVYIGVKRMGIEVLRLNLNGTLVHEELIPCWDSPFGVKLHGTHPNRRMLVADKIGGIREFKTS
jgi:hypothetical protein